MIGARTGGVSKTRPILCNELGAERVEPRIANRGGGRNNEFPIGRLLRPQSGRALQNMRLFLGGKWAGSPIAGIEAELLMLVKLAGDLDEITALQRVARFVVWTVTP